MPKNKMKTKANPLFISKYGSVSKNADLRFMLYIKNNLRGDLLGDKMKFDVRRKYIFDNLFFERKKGDFGKLCVAKYSA
jgi:hypothetical protein